MKKNFEPNLAGFAGAVAAGAACLCVLVGFVALLMRDAAFLALAGTIIGIAISLIVDYFLAALFFHAAADKGYSEAIYFYIAFLFPGLGYLLIVALPDLKTRAAIAALQVAAPEQPAVAQKKVAEPLVKQASAPVKPATPVQKSAPAPKPVPEKSAQLSPAPVSAKAKTFAEHLDYALNYYTDDGMAGYIRRIAEQPDLKEHHQQLNKLLSYSNAEMRVQIQQLRNSREKQE